MTEERAAYEAIQEMQRALGPLRLPVVVYIGLPKTQTFLLVSAAIEDPAARAEVVAIVATGLEESAAKFFQSPEQPPKNEHPSFI